MRSFLFFCFIIMLIITCSCTSSNEYNQQEAYEIDQEAQLSREITLGWLEQNLEAKDVRLIFDKYAAIACVLDTGYTVSDDFDPEDPEGFATGQNIEVIIIDGVIINHDIYSKGKILRDIMSYGGDTVIVGKPEIGDIVGYRLGYYAEIWEKINLSQSY